jgi:non-ribosomal peptide synthetase component F
VHERFEQQVDRTPDAPAATCGDMTLSYRELDAGANQVALQVLSASEQPGLPRVEWRHAAEVLLS